MLKRLRKNTTRRRIRTHVRKTENTKRELSQATIERATIIADRLFKKTRKTLLQSGFTKYDLVQDALLRLARKGWKIDPERIDNYLAIIMQNLITDYYRRGKHRRTHSLRDEDPGKKTSKLTKEQLRERLIARIRKIDFVPAALEDFIEYYLSNDGQTTIAELARKRRVNLATMHTRFIRIRERIRGDPHARELYEDLIE